MVRQQLCPHFSGLQSPQETCSMPLHCRPCVLCSIAKFAEREEEPISTWISLGKEGGGRQDAEKLL